MQHLAFPHDGPFSSFVHHHFWTIEIERGHDCWWWLRCVNLSSTFSTCSGTTLGGSSCVELVRGYGWEHLEMHKMYRFDVWMIWVIELLITYILSDSSKPLANLAKQGTLSVQLPHLPVFWASWPATFVGDDCSCTSSECKLHKPNIGHLGFAVCALNASQIMPLT